MRKNSEYTRDLEVNELRRIQNKHKHHLKSNRKGFLNTKQKSALLRISKAERGTRSDQIIGFFYEIRTKAESALKDLELLCDVLNEEQLEKIFLKKHPVKMENTQQQTIVTDNPIDSLIESLLPHPIFAEKKTQDEIDELLKDRQWRKYILENITVKSLHWYFSSGIFKTTAQKQIIFDALDAISVETTGKKKFYFGGRSSKDEERLTVD